MIPRPSTSTRSRVSWSWIYTLILLCNIVKVSSGYLINSTGIIRNDVIKLPNRPCLARTSLNRHQASDAGVIASAGTENAPDGSVAVGELPESSSNYSSDDIIILEGLNAVRKRPGMYIGNTGERGVHQLLYEVLDNSVDEYLAGFCNKITVSLMKDGSVEVSDNGRGIPCDISPKTGKSGLETVLTVLHSGGKFQDTLSAYSSSNPGSAPKTSKEIRKKEDEKKVYEYSSGLHGVGLSVVNALSEFLKVDVYKGTTRYHIELSKGQITKPLSEESFDTSEEKAPAKRKGGKGSHNPDLSSTRYGTTVRFMPDYEHIFKTHHQHVAGSTSPSEADKSEATCQGCTNGFILDLIKTRAKELAYLNPGLFIRLIDYRIPTQNGFWEELYHNTGGTRSFLEELTRDKTPLYKPISSITIKGNVNNVSVEVSFSWSLESYSAVIKAYANNVSTVAGTHIDGFKTSITRCVNGLLKKFGCFKGNIKPLNGDFIREGMTAVISVRLSGAEFDGQTKTKLGNTAVKTAVEKIMNEQFTNILENNKELLLAIHTKSQAAKKAYDAAKTAKELIRQKSSNLISNISGKLTECSSNNIERNELFIVEGESAAGNAKQARNRQFQAVLPLKGKILNIEKIADNNKVLENQQIQLLINTIGIDVNPITWRQKPNSPDSDASTGLLEIIERNSMRRLRYGKIILLTDADVDGSHLKALLLCLLYRLCPNLYLEGRVYVATPPLYRVTNLRNKKYIYSWSPEHLLKVIQQLNSDKKTEEIEAELGGEQTVDLESELRGLQAGSGSAATAQRDDFDFNTKLSRGNKNYIIQRFKGLGEMMAKQLWETTMDPQKRILKRIVVSHDTEISDIIRLLMGSDVQSRKQYIFNNSDAFQLQDLDI